jgi:O-antigen/teichoic acid export membrane protein
LLREFHQLTTLAAAEALFASCFVALLIFGRGFLREQIGAGFSGSLGGYRSIWNELARWSAFGVVLTELTANAHAYLVTFIAGPAAFAPLAIGSLLMRPVQLVLAAVPDRERPAMARLLGSGNYAAARHSVNHFRMAASAIWLLTTIAAVGLLQWFPQLVLRKGYDPAQAMAVLGFFAAITAVRSVRTPEAVLLQAAGQFRSLAYVSLWSSLVSLTATLLLLLVAGPVLSLAGILAGEIVVTMRVRAAARAWMQSRA